MGERVAMSHVYGAACKVCRRDGSARDRRNCKAFVALGLLLLLCVASRRGPRGFGIHHRKLLELGGSYTSPNMKAKASDMGQIARRSALLYAQLQPPHAQPDHANSTPIFRSKQGISARGEVNDLHSVPSSPNPIHNGWEQRP